MVADNSHPNFQPQFNLLYFKTVLNWWPFTSKYASHHENMFLDMVRLLCGNSGTFMPNTSLSSKKCGLFTYTFSLSMSHKYSQKDLNWVIVEASPWLVTHLLKPPPNGSTEFFSSVLFHFAQNTCMIFLPQWVDKRRTRESVSHNIWIYCFVKSMGPIITHTLTVQQTPTFKSSNGSP
jgi:hypothetical protein